MHSHNSIKRMVFLLTGDSVFSYINTANLIWTTLMTRSHTLDLFNLVSGFISVKLDGFDLSVLLWFSTCLFPVILTKQALRPTGDFVPFAAPPSTQAATTTTCTTTGPPTPQFSYHDINVYALAGLAPHININANVSFGHLLNHLPRFPFSPLNSWIPPSFSCSPSFLLVCRSRCCRPILSWNSVCGSQ